MHEDNAGKQQCKNINMKQILYNLFEHRNLSKEEARILLHNIAEGQYNDAQIASLLTVFLMRNISIGELGGFREALLELRHEVKLDDNKVIDIVGTGGDGKDTFNISTCASFVVAGAGYKVCKHGNYGASSVSGASNVMEYHGVKFSNSKDIHRRSVDKCNIAYLHAPLFNPALKAVANVRKNLGVRTFFNILGPLVNPAVPAYQLLGVYNLALLRLYSYMFLNNGTLFAAVHSLDGYDEISLTSDFKVNSSAGEKIYSPESIGFERCHEKDLYGGNTIEKAAKIFDNVLNNISTPAQKNSVIANAAFAISVITPEKDINHCISEAKYSLESGKAKESFKKFLEINS